jgi:hypothetical protein
MSKSSICKICRTAVVIVLVIASCVGIYRVLPGFIHAFSIAEYQTDHRVIEGGIETYDACSKRITMDVKLEYSTNKDAVDAICTRYGWQFDFERNFLADELTNAVREATTKREKSEIINEMVPIQDEIQNNLSDKLSDLGVTVDRIMIRDICDEATQARQSTKSR